MSAVITCPACQRKARVSRSAVGKTVKCPGCGTPFLAVVDDTDPPPSRVPPELEEVSEPSPESAASPWFDPTERWRGS